MKLNILVFIFVVIVSSMRHISYHSLNKSTFLLCLSILLMMGCRQSDERADGVTHRDAAFVQDYAVKYNFNDNVKPLRVSSDRNGVVQIATSENLYKP